MSTRPPEKGSDEMASKAKEWPELIVSGCADPTISKIVKGTYRVSTMNHNKPVYKKYEKAKGLDVLVYFWDDRDGLELCGWWFGPAVGGDQVWAFHPSRTSITPPANEWNIPNDGAIDPTFTITPRAKSSGSGGLAEKKPEDAAGDDDVRRQLENMKKERDEFAARMEEIQRRAEERRRREEELKRRMEGVEDPEKKPAKRSRADEEEQRRQRDGAMATARAEEERRRLERDALQKKEEDRRQAEDEARQRREEERRRIDEEAQRRREERQRKEEDDVRRRAERRKQEEVEERKRKEIEQAKRREDEDRRRKEEAKRQEERQRRLNEEAKKRKEEIAVLGMFDAMARMSAATPQDFDGLRLMLERALETLLPYTGKQKATLKTEVERVLKRTETYVKTAEEQQRKWEEWSDLREQVPMLLRS